PAKPESKPESKPEPEPEPEPTPDDPGYERWLSQLPVEERPRRVREKERARVEMELAIMSRRRPNGWDRDGVAPSDAVHWVQDDWEGEVKAREKTLKECPCPSRTTIETDLGFRPRRKR